MTKMPSAVWIVDTKKEHLAVDEARKLGIPVIAILDTNCDPDEVDYPIPGNDDAIRSVALLTRVIADAVAEGLMPAPRPVARPRGEGDRRRPTSRWPSGSASCSAGDGRASRGRGRRRRAEAAADAPRLGRGRRRGRRPRPPRPPPSIAAEAAAEAAGRRGRRGRGRRRGRRGRGRARRPTEARRAEVRAADDAHRTAEPDAHSTEERATDRWRTSPPLTSRRCASRPAPA